MRRLIMAGVVGVFALFSFTSLSFSQEKAEEVKPAGAAAQSQKGDINYRLIQLEGLSGKVSRLESRVNDMNISITQLQSDLKDMKTRMDYMRDQVNRLQDRSRI